MNDYIVWKLPSQRNEEDAAEIQGGGHGRLYMEWQVVPTPPFHSGAWTLSITQDHDLPRSVLGFGRSSKRKCTEMCLSKKRGLFLRNQLLDKTE